jgi:hypothetical protein
MFFWGDESTQRREFTIKTKRVDWLTAAGTHQAKTLLQNYLAYGKVPPKMPRSRCRVCGEPLTWGDGTYNFDHYDNNSANCSQRNCFLVCRNDHGKATRTKLITRYNPFTGEPDYLETIKLKAGYKKTPRKLTSKAPKKPASKTTRKPAKKTAKKPPKKTTRRPARKTARKPATKTARRKR